ncbi:hypothetical protein ACO0SA_000459 [Hanseniaspora valbyensis]
MRIYYFSIITFLFLHSTLVLSKRLLEVEPENYIIVDSDEEKFKLLKDGHKFVDVTDILQFDQIDNDIDDKQISWSEYIKSFIHFNKRKHLQKRSDVDESIKFWKQYQIFSFQDLIFDDSVLIKEERLPSNIKELVKVDLPKKPNQQKKFSSVYDKIESTVKQDLYVFINHFTQFYTRFYKSSFGKDASDWLFSQANQAINEAESQLPESLQKLNLISVSKFTHKNFMQDSILIKIKGSKGLEEKTDPKSVILASHLDSINLLFPYLLRAPGVDDNATGTSVSYFIFKTYLDYLVANAIEQSNDNLNKNIWPVNDIEFHFYAAEEGGLLGSLDVFASKSSQNAKIISMLQLDQLGYNELKTKGKIGLINDFVSEDVFEFLKLLIKNYLNVDFEVDTCGYGCSDHASAYKYGFPSGMVCESVLKNDNKFTHSALDTIDRVDFDWLEQFVKLGLSFVLELASYE